MSTERGNAHRTRSQKYQNHFTFKNSLHDTSKRTKVINNLQIHSVCERCKKIIEWKIKYKKYKPLSAPAKCNKCQKKTIKHAYHTICSPCAKEHKICPKCGKQSELVTPQPDKEEVIKLDNEMQEMIKTLPERKRRTFMRHVNKSYKSKNKKKSNIDEEDQTSDESSTEENESAEENIREYLFNKLKSLVIDSKKKINDSDSKDSSSEFSEGYSDFD